MNSKCNWREKQPQKIDLRNDCVGIPARTRNVVYSIQWKSHEDIEKTTKTSVGQQKLCTEMNTMCNWGENRPQKMDLCNDCVGIQ